MTELREIFQKLRRLPDTVVDRSMAAALPTADDLASRLMVLILGERKNAAGLEGLIEHYHRLPPDLRQVVISQGALLDGPLRSMARRDPQSAMNVLMIIRRARAAPLAYLVAEQARHGDDEVKHRAVECLFDMAQWTRDGRAASPLCDETAAVHVRNVVDKAVVNYAVYERPKILRALLAIASGPIPLAMRALADQRHPAVEPMRRLLASCDTREAREAVNCMIRVPALAGAVHEGIGKGRRNGFLCEVVSRSHLLLHRGASAELERAPDVEVLVPEAKELGTWPALPARGFPRWIRYLGMAPADEVRTQSRLSSSTDAPVRLSALRRLISLAGGADAEGADDAIARFCTDPDGQIGRIALRHLIRIGWPRLPRILPHLINSGASEVRQMASSHLAPVGFDRLWQAWTQLDPNQQAAAGRALIKIDPKFHGHLGAKLGLADRPEVLRALAMIDRLNQGSLFEPALLALAGHDDEVVVSAAVKALRCAESDEARRAVENALNHRDGRVRANAVESLEQLKSTRHVRQLTSMAQGDENRPRANAIQSLLNLRVRDALGALSTMLNDRRPNHRISALWLVQSMGMVDVASHVAEMSVSDPDLDVQDRAGVVIQQLIRLLSGSPSAPQVSPQPAATAESR